MELETNSDRRPTTAIKVLQAWGGLPKWYCLTISTAAKDEHEYLLFTYIEDHVKSNKYNIIKGE